MGAIEVGGAVNRARLAVSPPVPVARHPLTLHERGNQSQGGEEREPHDGK